MRVTRAIDILSVSGIISGQVGTKRVTTDVIRRRYTDRKLRQCLSAPQENFRTLDNLWPTLGTAEKASWANYQRWRKLTGMQSFFKWNLKRMAQGLPPVDTPDML